MYHTNLKFLTLSFLISLSLNTHSKEVWTEHFPGLKGITSERGNISTMLVIETPVSQSHDIVINEIMADPNPVQGLPEEEFIELYNRSSNAINLDRWVLRVREAEKKLKIRTILPGEYLILCKTRAVDTFNIFGESMGVPGFPSLINKGATIQLKNEEGTVVDAITYSEEWYGDTEKDNGGWSLERIDPNRFCGQQQNWMASTNQAGGTPGSVNAVRSDNPDLESPVLTWATAVSDNQIELMFSETMDTLSLAREENYLLSDKIGPPDEVTIMENGGVILHFPGSFTENKNYTLEFNQLTDECSNPLSESSAVIQWIEINSGDVVINEVLFDPFPDGADFVELVNISQKSIPFYRLSLASRDEFLELKQLYKISEEKSTWGQGEYLLCTSSSKGISDFYFSACTECFIEMNKFPTYPNENGYVVLLADSNKIIDEFMYSETMHSEVLYDKEGISLERINFTVETNRLSSWHSAAENVGFATPGYQNSEFTENITKNSIVVEPEAFSPNNDGYNDQVNLVFHLDEPGYIANSWIFDSKGRMVYQLMKNQILGTNGKVEWNGRDDSGRLLPLGAYIILVEVFNMSGEVMKFKNVCVLTDVWE